VLAHLATCTDCREVVALAAPEATEGLEVVAPHKAKPRWLSVPVMQWGTVAAAVAVVAVAVVMQSPRMQQPATFHEGKSLAVASADKPAPPPPPAVASARKASERERDAATTRLQNGDLRDADVKNNRSEVRTKEARLDDLAMKRDELAKQKKEDGDRALAIGTPSAAAPTPPAPVVSARRADSGSVVSLNGSGVVTSSKVGEERAAGGASAGTMAQAERNEPSPEAGSLESGHKDSKLARPPAQQQLPAKPASPAAAADSVVSVNGGSLNSAKAGPIPEPPQRAKSSEPTTPAAMSPGVYGPGYAGESMARGAPAAELRLHSRLATARWTVTSDGRVQRSLDGGHNWADVPITKDKAVKFRALATDGDEVWAGGTRGALYYSADAGSTWRAHPLGLSGDIVRLSVNGKSLAVSTSSGQTIQVSHDAFGDAAAKPPSNR